jgi:hypothetical protein
MTICGKWGANGARAWLFRITNSSTLSLSVGNNGSVLTTFTATTPFVLAPNTWYNIVAERWSGYTRFYVNGIQCGTVSAFNSANGTATGPTYIGTNGDGFIENFIGYIDSIRVTAGITRYSPTKLSAATSGSVFLYRPELSFPNG